MERAILPESVAELPEGAGRIAVFDADGTLWEGDVADEFTLWLIARGELPAAAWPAYEALNRVDVVAAAFRMLEFYRGWTPERFAARVAEWWSAAGGRTWIAPVVAALRHLAVTGHEVWVVTASPAELIRRGIEAAGLPVARVVGMEFEQGPDGRFTGRPRGIAPAGPGKARAVAALAAGRPVAFAAGNSELDTEMLALAERALAVRPSEGLRAVARSRGWSVLR